MELLNAPCPGCKQQRQEEEGEDGSKPQEQEEESESEREWKALPQGPLSLISDQPQSEIDVVRFRSVCTLWRSAAPRRQSPWFLAHSNGDESPRYALFSLSLARIPDLPDICLTTGDSCCGSSQGWLAFFGGLGEPITLLNPITGGNIHLPVITGLDPLHCYPRRLILSSNPVTTPDYTVATLCKTNLAIYRPGDEAWSITQVSGFPGSYYPWGIAFHRGLIYIAGANRISVFDPAAKVKFVRATTVPCMYGTSDEPCCGLRPWNNRCSSLSSFFVESCGDLLLVRIHMSYASDSTRGEILKLQFCGRRLSGTVKMESLGDRALFIGPGCSFSLSAISFPEYKGNHIYFMRKWDVNVGTYIQVVSLTDGKVKPATSELQRWDISLWFRPQLL